jgi:ribosomal protein L27
MNVRRGADDTLYAAKPGRVAFKLTKKALFNGKSRYATKVSVLS